MAGVGGLEIVGSRGKCFYWLLFFFWMKNKKLRSLFFLFFIKTKKQMVFYVRAGAGFGILTWGGGILESCTHVAKTVSYIVLFSCIV